MILMVLFIRLIGVMSRSGLVLCCVCCVLCLCISFLCRKC